MNKDNEFVKLFSTDTHQVLITKESHGDDDQDVPYLNQSTEAGGLRIALNMGFKTVESRDEAFDSYDSVQANKFIKSVEELMAEMTEDKPEVKSKRKKKK